MTAPPSWDLLVYGGTVLTMAPDAAPIERGAVAIADGRIAAVGPTEELLELAPTGEILDASRCIILPGLVNTHSHLAMTLMRGLADDLPLRTWLEEHVWPAEARLINAETVRAGTRLAALEQLLGGVTTAADMYFYGEVVGRTLAEVGLRGVVSEALIDFPTPRCRTQEEMFDAQRALAAAFAGHPLISAAVAAHSPYSVSAANLAREAQLADDLGLALHIHLSETRWEVEKLLADKGISPVAYLADLGVLGERTVAAHCVHVSPEDIEILAELEVGVSHNPVSNLKLGSGVSPVPAMAAAGVKLGLGTDGAASNNTLDLLRDMQLAALLHKGVTLDATAMPARAMLEIATVGGARVLGLDDRVGTLVPGKEADLICVTTDRAHATPVYDPFSHMAYAARSSDVRHVLVRGSVLVRDGVPTTLDLDEVRREALTITDGFRG